MNYILITSLFSITMMVAMIIYGCGLYWSLLDLPRAYDDFMALLINYSHIFKEHDFYTKIESDFEKRQLPDFKPTEFEEFIKTSPSLKEEEKENIIHAFRKVLTTLEVKAVNGASRGNFAMLKGRLKVRPAFRMSKNQHFLMLTLIGLSFGLYMLTKPLANKQLLTKYRAVGIESLDERFVSEDIAGDAEAKIVNKIYKNRFGGGAYYGFKLEIAEPIPKTIILEVDPMLYQDNKQGDLIPITVNYTKKVDRYKGTEEIDLQETIIHH